MNLNAAVAKAKRIIEARKKISSSNANKIIVTKEWVGDTNGELVLILYTDSEDN